MEVATGILKSAIKKAGALERAVVDVLDILQSGHGIEKEVGLGKGAQTFWGTDEQTAAFRKAKEEAPK